MESLGASSLKNLVTKFSLFSNIIPYLGYLDEVYFFMTYLCKASNKNLTEYSDIIFSKLLVDNVRIHPNFDSETFATIQSVKRAMKGVSNQIFKMPKFSLNPGNIDSSEYDHLITSEWASKMKFSKISFGGIYQYDNYIRIIKDLQKNPNFKSNMTDIVVSQISNWQSNRAATPLPCVEQFDFYSHNNSLSFDETIDLLNSAQFPIKIINASCVLNYEKPSLELNEVVKNSVESFTFRLNNSIDQYYYEASDILVDLFPNLKKITYISNRDTLEQINSALKDARVREIEEFYTYNMYYTSVGATIKMEIENCTFYFESTAGTLKPMTVGKASISSFQFPKLFEVNEVPCLVFTPANQIVFSGYRPSPSKKGFKKPKDFPDKLANGNSSYI